MLKQTYVGVVDFHGANWARVSGADLSQMTGATGTNVLVLENVTGLHGTLNFLGINSLEVINSNMAEVNTIYCNTKFKTDNLKKQNWNGLFVFHHVGPVKPGTKLIRDLIQNGH